MRMTPHQARLALASFLFVSAAMTTNLLYLQDEALVSKVGKVKAERAKLRAEAERKRRLALDDREAVRPVSNQAGAVGPLQNASLATIDVRGSGQGIGRFAPTAGSLDQTPAEPEMRMPDIVRALQALLAQRGYEPGIADGTVGTTTRAAILAYEHDQGLPLTAEPSEALLLHMKGLRDLRTGPQRAARGPRSPQVEQLIRTAQLALFQIGYFTGKIDGLGGEETVRAIREYEMDQGLVPTGRVSAPLLTRLGRATAARAAQR